MHYRLNSFYNEGLHPFITSMARYLLGAQRRATTPSFVKALSSTAQWEADKKIMNDIVNKGQPPLQANFTEA
jgi:cytochrome P450 / NADPH-cytochrome P450 reductase